MRLASKDSGFELPLAFAFGDAPTPCGSALLTWIVKNKPDRIMDNDHRVAAEDTSLSTIVSELLPPLASPSSRSVSSCLFKSSAMAPPYETSRATDEA